MYWLIEEGDQLEVLLNSGYKEAYIDVIPSSHNVHPVQNNVSLVYFRPINAHKGYMICVTHSETLGVSKTSIDRLLEKFEVLYCRDKKELLHYFPLKTLVDINIFPNTYIQELTNTHDIFYYKHKDKPNVNEMIPVVKHYEMCEDYFNYQYERYKNQKPTKYAEFYNSRVSVVFNAIERSGLRVHVPRFQEHFHPIDSERVYSQYNLKTLTTRPSNKFKGVN